MQFRFHLSILLVCAGALCGCARARVDAHPEASNAATDDARVVESNMTLESGNTRERTNFSAYASVSIGGNKRCVAGAELDEDGMHQKPVIYLSEGANKRVVWRKTLPLPADVYQSRATHCLLKSNALYVLLQSDTQPQQSLSQTLLRVVKLRPDDGGMQIHTDIQLPGVMDACSAWVNSGPRNFRWQNGALVISGHYFRLADDQQRRLFQVSLSEDLIH